MAPCLGNLLHFSPLFKNRKSQQISIDLQEYLGSYVSDEQGRLVFREGALVTALRQGHWVVLDELNLAPSEVLEALNRYLTPFMICYFL